jgi:hypothetical protein
MTRRGRIGDSGKTVLKIRPANGANPRHKQWCFVIVYRQIKVITSDCKVNSITQRDRTTGLFDLDTANRILDMP